MVKVIGVRSRGIFKILAQNGCFLSFQGEKTNFATFSSLTKILEIALVAHPGKNPSDTCGYVFGLGFTIYVCLCFYQAYCILVMRYCHIAREGQIRFQI